MIDLTKLFSSWQASRGSIRIYVPEIASLSDKKEAVNHVAKILDDLRDADRDTGVAIIFSKTKIIKDNYAEATLTTVRDVAKNNKVGLDLYKPVFMSKSVKALFRDIREIIKKTKTYSVRVKTNYSMSMIIGRVLVSFFGLALIAYAQKFPVQSQKFFDKIEITANFSQICGLIFGLLPWIVETIINYFASRGKK